MNLLDIFFPKRCVGCGKIGKYFCLQCRRGIKLIEKNESICPVCGRPAIDGVTHPHCRERYTPDGLTSFFHYDGIVKKAIKSIKYRFVSDLAAEFVSLVPETSMACLPKYALVPIPLHISRLRFRGFNQAEKLGILIAGQLNIPVNTDILCRTINTVPQVEMKHRSERLENMEKVFSVIVSFSGSGFILFDDVFTTGSTMRAATNVLKRAGVKHVWAVTMAR
jgi:competence protein ComFC